MSETFKIDVNKQKIELTKENLVKYGVLDQSKVDVFWHPAKKKVIIAAKISGKTYPVKIKEIWRFEKEKNFNSFDFRKHKDKAARDMGNALNYAVSTLERKGFKLSKYKKSTGIFYRVTDKRNSLNNQAQIYASLQNISATDGSYPSNGGYYGIKHIDEPIVLDDMKNPDGIPNKKDWDYMENHIDDNLDRFNLAFKKSHNLSELPQYESIYTMNDFGKHPLSVEAQEKFPREKFLKWFLGHPLEDFVGNKELVKKLSIDELLKKHTLMEYCEDEEDPDTKDPDGNRLEWNGTLYVRMTKFANPLQRDEKIAKVTFVKIQRALFTGNAVELARLIGAGVEWDAGIEQKSFNIQDYNLIKTEEWLKNYDVSKICYGVDVDTSRVITVSPELLGVNKLTGKYSTHTMTIIELKVNGTGMFGELIEPIAKKIHRLIHTHYNSYFGNKKITTYCFVDDFRKEVLHHLFKLRTGTINSYQKAPKHNKYGLFNRQEIVNIGANSGISTISIKNIDLIKDYKNCIREDLSSEIRKTKGSTNYLDRIDARDYGLIPFHNCIRKGGR